MEEISTKQEILVHLNDLYNNLPEFIKLIEECPEEKNKDGFWEVIVKSRDMNYWVQKHLEIHNRVKCKT